MIKSTDAKPMDNPSAPVIIRELRLRENDMPEATEFGAGKGII